VVVDSFVPCRSVPNAFGGVETWYCSEQFRHDTCWSGFVGPYTTVYELSRCYHILGSVEDFGTYADHATCEASKMLAFRVEGSIAVGLYFNCAGNEYVAIVGG